MKTKKAPLVQGPFSVKQSDSYLGYAFKIVGPDGKDWGTHYGKDVKGARMTANIEAARLNQAFRLGANSVTQ